jgi:amidase
MRAVALASRVIIDHMKRLSRDAASGYWDMNEPDFDKYIAKWTDAAFLFPFNLSGLPAVSVPAAWTTDDIPIGVQLVGRYGDEATILRLSAQLEKARPWVQRCPSICAGA